jgi:hypothetical protein
LFSSLKYEKIPSKAGYFFKVAEIFTTAQPKNNKSTRIIQVGYITLVALLSSWALTI